jgi:hypothetical protein
MAMSAAEIEGSEGSTGGTGGGAGGGGGYLNTHDDVALNYELNKSQTLQNSIEAEVDSLRKLLDYVDAYQLDPSWDQISFSDYKSSLEAVERANHTEPVALDCGPAHVVNK